MHDAGKLIDDLRDHLARHDKRIAFLFGAGTSVSDPSSESNDSKPLIPIVSELTELCKRRVEEAEESYADAWEKVYLACKEDMDRDPNIEDILSRVHMMVEAVSSSETLADLNKEKLTEFESIIRKEVANIANPKIDSIVKKLPHRKFARWLRQVVRQHPVEIFTVNYDVLLEAALEADRVPFFDGFVGSYQPFFYPDSLRHERLAPDYTRLWKMHGSVTWHKETDTSRIVRGKIDGSGEMILPSSQKYDESRRQPYVAFTDKLSRFLESKDALLIVCGFSFGDQHINDIIFASLENHPRTHVYALQYSDPGKDTDLMKRGKLPNMIIAGLEEGTISGNTAKWGIHSGSDDDRAWFESKPTNQTSARSNNSANEMTPGKMKIVDFVQFCDFLESITTKFRE